MASVRPLRSLVEGRRRGVVGGALALTALLAPGAASGAIPPAWDGILHAVDRAALDLAAGEDRAEVLERFDRAIETHPGSEHLDRAKRLRADLAFSVEVTRVGQAPDGEGPAPFVADLMDTVFPLDLTHRLNRGYIPRFLEDHPGDPMTRVLTADRGVIELLMPLLEDPSPTRSYSPFPFIRTIPVVPRVSDMALFAIEYHSKCQFRPESVPGAAFHELPGRLREATTERIREWWGENHWRSLAGGIRSQLPYAEFAGRLRMAEDLAALDGQREYALEVLRSLVRSELGSRSAYAAEALAGLGDLSGLDILYERWRHLGRVAHEEGFESSVVFFLTKYGGRREWELLHHLAASEARDGLGPGTRVVFPAVVRSGAAATCPWAIPTLGLALEATERVGTRGVEGGRYQSYSLADEAAERLQDLTGVSFEYRREGAMAERLAAIERVQAWWEAEGRKRYDFEFISNLVKDGDCGHRP